MTRQEVLDQITQTLGAVPDWLSGLPDPQLEYQSLRQYHSMKENRHDIWEK